MDDNGPHDETLEVPDTTQPPARQGASLLNDPALGFILLAAGVAIIAITARMESDNLADKPWTGAIFSPEGEAPWEGAYTIYARRIPVENFPNQEAMQAQVEETFGDAPGSTVDVSLTEWFIAIDAPNELIKEIIESPGRVPHPTGREVARGALTRSRSFKIGRIGFTSVAYIQPSVGGLAFAYVTPYHESLDRYFGEESGATKGWLEPNGAERMAELENPSEALKDQTIVGARAPTKSVYSWGVIVGLMFVAAGGAMIQVRLFQILAGRNTGPFRPIFTYIRGMPFLLGVLHIGIYGIFFMAMALAMRSPFAFLLMGEMVSRTFQEGELAHIGSAYASGNIPLAAAVTFNHNFFVATVMATIIPSLIIPFFGVLKTLGSFAVAGFAMAPLFTGAAADMVFHCITMTLELEAYVIAAFAVTLYPIRFVAGFARSASLRRALVEGLSAIGSGTLLAAIMLAVAALYEAVSLILLR